MATTSSNLTAGGNINICTHTQYAGPLDQDPFKFLLECSALGALHDSAERPDPPKCHPETREAIQEKIHQWAIDRSPDAKPILWLTGAAGAGKSAIAQTLTEKWKKVGIIVPNFFCWRTSPKRNQKTRIIPTLAFQLTKGPSSARSKLAESLRNTGILERNLKSQVEELIVSPLTDILANGQIVVIVIDGMDEVCVDLPPNDGFPGQSYEEQQREVLEAMTHACEKLPSLRIFIASRPERQIRTSFAESLLASLSLVVSLVDESNVNADITLYLKCKFTGIRRRHPGISPSWPSDEQVSLLVEKSSGQFIYPSTVIKYISRGRQFPVKSLEDVLALRTTPNNQKRHPLAELDALYTLVLRSVVPESWHIVRLILGLVCHEFIVPHLPALSGPPALTPMYVERFLMMSCGELSVHLTDLHSLLYIPNYSHQPGIGVIRSLHATLSEYLKDKSRSENLSISEGDIYAYCSGVLLKHIKSLACVNQSIKLSTKYSNYNKVATFRSFLFQASPSTDLMMALWDFLKADIGEYSCGDVPKSHWFVLDDLNQKDLRSGQEIHICPMVEYLLKCNIPTFEPSQSHRGIIDQRLKEYLVQNYPHHPIAVRYVESKKSMVKNAPDKAHNLAENHAVHNSNPAKIRDASEILNAEHNTVEIPDVLNNPENIPDVAQNLERRRDWFRLLYRFIGWVLWDQW